jgi:hypothetical protein
MRTKLLPSGTAAKIMADPSVIPHRLPPKHYQVMGELIEAWTHLEYNIERLIWLLLGIKHREGRILTTGMPARNKLNVLGLLGKHYSPTPEITKDIAELILRTTPLVKVRNDIAHGVWTHPPGNRRLLYVMKAAGELENRLQPSRIRYTERSIAKHARLTRALRFDALRLRIGIALAPSSSPRKPSGRSLSGPLPRRKSTARPRQRRSSAQ